jgi:hypothetical protein
MPTLFTNITRQHGWTEKNSRDLRVSSIACRYGNTDRAATRKRGFYWTIAQRMCCQMVQLTVYGTWTVSNCVGSKCLIQMQYSHLPTQQARHKAMDAGIIQATKGKARKKFVQWVLEMMDSDEQVTADKLKPDIRQAMMWMRDAWTEVKKETIVNC